jgi:hypothetical protein
MMDSGMIFISGIGGGSEEMKHLNLGCAFSYTVSSIPSSPFIPTNQVYIRCTFCNKIQFPSLAELNKAFLAIIS